MGASIDDLISQTLRANRAPLAGSQLLAARQEAAETAQREQDKSAIEQDDSVRGKLDRAGAFVHGAADTMSLGLADEVRGLWTGAGALLPGGESPVEGYVRGRDAQREATAITQENAPMAYGVGTIAGAIPGMLGGGGSVAATKTVGQGIAQGAKIGAGTGAVTGFAQGEGLSDSAKKAALSAGIGALLGGSLGGGAKILGDKAARGAAVDAAGNAIKGAASGAKAKVSGAAEKAAPMLQKLVERADKMDPVARATLNLSTGGTFGAVTDAARTLMKLAPEVFDDAGRGATMWADDLAMSADDLAAMRGVDATGAVAPAPAAPPPAPAAPTQPAIKFLAPVDDVAEATVTATAPKLPAPAPAAGVEDVAAPVAKLSRRLTDDEATALVRSVALKEGTLDVASLASKSGLSSSQTQRAVQELSKLFKFRDEVARVAAGKAGPVAPTAESTLPAGTVTKDVGAANPVASKTPAMTPAPRSGSETAESVARAERQLAVDPMGRQAAQVAATKQATEWRAIYDRLPSHQRADYVARLLENNHPEKVRTRLGLTKREWRLFSPERAGAQSRARAAGGA